MLCGPMYLLKGGAMVGSDYEVMPAERDDE